MKDTLGFKKNNIERVEHDFYATPTEEVENILNYETLVGNILEPCCGMGHMVHGIINKGYTNIMATDLIDRGYGITGLDFLKEDYPYTENINSIVINPPYKTLEAFVKKSLEIATDKVILLSRSQFIEGVSRYKNILKENPPSRIYQYVNRITCYKNGDKDSKDNISGITYSWFIWDVKSEDKNTYLKWIHRVDKK